MQAPVSASPPTKRSQSEFGVSQHVLGTFWTPAEAFGAELEAHSEADLQTLLDQFVSQVTAQ